jgi:hypothetical protein
MTSESNNKQQRTISSSFFTKPVTNTTTKNKYQPIRERQSINVPPHLYRKLLDFLEDKWETSITRRNDVFYTTTTSGQQIEPIAWLNSQDTVTIALKEEDKCPSTQSTSSSQRSSNTSSNNTILRVKIQDIKLPTPIRVEYKLYQRLLFHLIRKSKGGVTRRYNRFFSTFNGCLLAELASSNRIKVYETHGLPLFGVVVSSREIDLNEYAPSIKVPAIQYLHLLHYFEKESGSEEISRISNTFYPKPLADSIRQALKTPSCIDRKTACLLESTRIAELVSQEVVRLRDGTEKKISDLVTRKERILRKHLYFCQSCQSFLQQPYKTTIHKKESEEHVLTYLSSYLLAVPEIAHYGETKRTRRLETSSLSALRGFPSTLQKFWGMEKGKLADNNKNKGRKHHAPVYVPSITQGKSKPITTRTYPKIDLLLLADAEISIDGRSISREERISALQRLEAEDQGILGYQEVQKAPSHESPPKEIYYQEKIPSSSSRCKINEEEGNSPTKTLRRVLRKKEQIKKALQEEDQVFEILPGNISLA